MPRGRIGQSPKDAAKRTEFVILTVITENPAGITFTEWWRTADIHKDTLATWLPKLVRRNLVRIQPQLEGTKTTNRKRYFPTKELLTRYSKRMLFLEAIERKQSSVSILGGGGASLDPFEDLVAKSTIGIAVPGTRMEVLEIKDLIHSEFISYHLMELVRRNMVDPRKLVGSHRGDLVSTLKAEHLWPRGDQVIAFLIDLETLRSQINVDYLKPILKKIESKYGRELRRRGSMKSCIEFVSEKGHTSDLRALGTHLNVSMEETKNIVEEAIHLGEIRRIRVGGAIYLSKT